MLNRNLPVARFVVLILVILAVVLFGELDAFEFISERSRLKAELRTSVQVMADQLAASLALPVWNFDQPQLDKIAESVMQDLGAAGVIAQIKDASSTGGIRTFGLVRDEQGVIHPITAAQSGRPGTEAFQERRPILAAGEPVGAVEVFFTPRFMRQELQNHLFHEVTIFLAFGAIMMLILYLLLCGWCCVR